MLNITPELQAEAVLVSAAGFLPLKRTHMLVCRIRWYSEVIDFRPVMGRRSFCISKEGIV